MTNARSLLVDLDTHGLNHFISRCVRRTLLWGVDPYSGTSYEHRRAWVEARLLKLAEIASVGVYAYAAMSNHVHVVLRIDPTAAATCTDEDIATRWVRLFPSTVDGEIDEAGCRMRSMGSDSRSMGSDSNGTHLTPTLTLRHPSVGWDPVRFGALR